MHKNSPLHRTKIDAESKGTKDYISDISESSINNIDDFLWYISQQRRYGDITAREAVNLLLNFLNEQEVSL